MIIQTAKTCITANIEVKASRPVRTDPVRRSNGFNALLRMGQFGKPKTPRLPYTDPLWLIYGIRR
jgi:hypothetical protein